MYYHKKHDSPKTGQIWSLEPIGPFMDKESPLVLVIGEPEDASDRFTCLPLFGAHWWATDKDLLIFDEEWSMAGERWVATEVQLDVSIFRFFIKAGEVSNDVLREILRFKKTGTTSLQRGKPVIPELADTRVELRKAWQEELMQWVEPPFLKRIFVQMDQAVLDTREPSTSSDRTPGEAFEEYKSGEMKRLEPSVAHAAMRSEARFTSIAYPVKVGDYSVHVVITPGSNGSAVTLNVDADQVYLETDSGRIPLEKVSGNLWMIADASLIEPGTHRFLILGKYGEQVLELVLHLDGGDK